MSLERLQLPLPLPYSVSFDPRDFIPAASNADALTWLGSDWLERRLALWGPAGCGKSHLLHVWAAREGGTVVAGPELDKLGRLSDGRPVAVDDADLVPRDEALLHLLNSARDQAVRILLSGRTAPARWRVQLPDLSSRLRAIIAVEIGAPDDALMAALLVRLLAERQLTVSSSLQTWLLTRLHRSAAALRTVVEALDRESLLTRKAITRPLAMQVLRSPGLSGAAVCDDSKAVVDPASPDPESSLQWLGPECRRRGLP